MASAAEAIVKIVPDTAEFTGALQAALEDMAPPAEELLTAFADWLDTDQRMIKRPYCGGDSRTPRHLAAQFLTRRRAEREAARAAADDDE